ncbi:MAG: Smr/MutS family protein [Vicinamibacterales bacterium]
MPQDPDEPIVIPIEDAIDLHAFAPRDVVAVVDDYLQAAHDAGLRQVRLVHGRGIGVQRAAVQRLLARHALVERYWDAPESSLGATVAVLVESPPASSASARDTADR